MAATTLIFVYNVDATPLALLRDLHQAITTGSTDCRLCDLTFGRLLKKPEWARFVKTLPVAVEFRMRSTFQRRYPGFEGHRFPAVFQLADGQPQEILSADALDGAADLDGLRELVERRLHALGLIATVAVEP